MGWGTRLDKDKPVPGLTKTNLQGQNVWGAAGLPQAVELLQQAGWQVVPPPWEDLWVQKLDLVWCTHPPGLNHMVLAPCGGFDFLSWRILWNQHERLCCPIPLDYWGISHIWKPIGYRLISSLFTFPRIESPYKVSSSFEVPSFSSTFSVFPQQSVFFHKCLFSMCITPKRILNLACSKRIKKIGASKDKKREQIK